jgi:hypothetical protein
MVGAQRQHHRLSLNRPHGENRRLRRDDQRVEASDPERAQIGDRERGREQLLGSEPPTPRCFREAPPRRGDISKRELICALDHRADETVVERNGEGDVDLVMLDDAFVGGRVARGNRAPGLPQIPA